MKEIWVEHILLELREVRHKSVNSSFGKVAANVINLLGPSSPTNSAMKLVGGGVTNNCEKKVEIW